MYQCVIVGGGIHGTSLLGRLLADTVLEREDILVVDPHDRLLASFRQKAAACEMEALRSPYVHHIGTEPFGLESFAHAQDREDELHPTPGYPRRPAFDLFCAYAESVIERHDLEALHRQATVESIAETQAGLILETDSGPILAQTCVLAIGHGGRYRWPSWAQRLTMESDYDCLSHIWDPDFDLAAVAGDVAVVGGGITAGQAAGCLADRLRTVSLLTRTPIERAVIEADPRWINWNHIERNLHCHLPGSPARLETVREAHNSGTMPPWVYENLESNIDAGRLTHYRDEVALARIRSDGRLSLRLESGRRLEADQLILATGFEPVFDHPFVGVVASDLDLERGYRGMPVLSDETLAWKRCGGDPSPVFVTGALAAGSVGPVAGTIVGARRSADRIVQKISANTHPRSTEKTHSRPVVVPSRTVN